MVLKLYGNPVSTCTRRVAVVLKEKNVPFEFVSIDFATGQHKTPEYITKQPFGQVPYLDDDGFIVYESRAIARYIAIKYADQGTPLVPAHNDLKAIAIFEQAASVEYSDFDPSASAAAWEKVFKVYRGLKTDDVRLAEHLKTLEAKLDVYDVILSKQKYMAGDKISLADLFHLPYGAMLAHSDPELMTRKPNVARWWNDITSRPSWQAVKDGVESVPA